MGRDQEHVKRLSQRLYNGITSQLQVGGVWVVFGWCAGGVWVA